MIELSFQIHPVVLQQRDYFSTSCMTLKEIATISNEQMLHSILIPKMVYLFPLRQLVMTMSIIIVILLSSTIQLILMLHSTYPSLFRKDRKSCPLSRLKPGYNSHLINIQPWDADKFCTSTFSSQHMAYRWSIPHHITGIQPTLGYTQVSWIHITA